LAENKEPLAPNMNLNSRINANLDRRRTFRKVPEKFAFIQLERDDGGAVLNVSEGGLSFNTFAPVEQSGPIHFWFSLNLNERIDAWGEVTWTDETKKLGGLRFIRLPERAERQIREWISRPIARQAPDERYTRQAAGGRPSRVVPREPDAVARFVSKARSQRTPIQSDSILSAREDSAVSNASSPFPEGIETTAGFVPKPRLQRAPILSSGILSGDDSVDSSAPVPPPGEMPAVGELVPMQRFRSAKRRQLILGLILGTCISATVAVAAIKYSNRRHENTGQGTAPSVSAAQKSGEEALPPVPVSPSASGGSTDIFGSSNRKTGASGASTGKILATPTGGHPGPNKWEASASNLPARPPVQPSLSGRASQKKTSATPQQLWASVQAGNSTAAVALAELYIKGEGVPQNCNQARVLLLVASEKRNATAIKRLAELDKTGCPTD
jgi:hypothetical protein